MTQMDGTYSARGLDGPFEDREERIEEEARRIVSGGGERNTAYGDYEREADRIAAGWSQLVGVEIKPRQVPLMMTWLKLVREEHSHKRDNLVDGIGYLLLLDEMGPQKVARDCEGVAVREDTYGIYRGDTEANRILHRAAHRVLGTELDEEECYCGLQHQRRNPERDGEPFA